MREDIERDGMAAYVSEVAINTALMDAPFSEGKTGFNESPCVGDETGDGNTAGLRHMQAGSSASYLRLPYMVEELGDLDSSTLVGGKTDHE